MASDPQPVGARPRQPADARARRWALTLLVVGALFGAAAIVGVERELAELRQLADVDPQRAIELMTTYLPALAWLLVAPLVAFALFGYWIAYRTRASGRFPPPGMAVVRATPILEGGEARRRALLLFVLTTVVLAMAMVVPVLLIRLVAALAEGR